MADADLADRLAAFESLKGIPQGELAWLASHGEVQRMAAGEVIADKGGRIRFLYIPLSGRLAVRVDRGAGPRRVMEVGPGEVTGRLPYSRMGVTIGRSFADERTETLAVDPEHFPAMIHHCPVFTAHCVHVMIDRARLFTASDLHDEKMVSLGKLAAGLAHELNNPSSATARGAQLLRSRLGDAQVASRALGEAGLTAAQRGTIDRLWAACQAKPGGAALSPIEQAEREDRIAAWLARHGCDPAHAGPLANSPASLEALDVLAGALSGATLDAALRWIAASCSIDELVLDIESAATRIHELVAAVKRFTWMDHLAGPDAVDVEGGLRDTVRVVGSKARGKSIALALDVAPGLPQVRAAGPELNQVWLNLIDNALDAAPASGHVAIGARREHDRVVVSITDDGAGIPDEILPRIFDAFFTTKPPGQGTGLGLEIARQLVRRSGGDIGVDSRPGRTEFRVSLAVAAAAPAAADGGRDGAVTAG